MATINQAPLGKKIVYKNTFKTVIVIGILYLVFRFFIKLVFPNEFNTQFLVLDLLVLSMPLWYYAYQYSFYKSYFYDIRNDFFVLKKGVFTPREASLPYDKFQDVYIDQDILDRIFGIYDVHVSTATGLSGMHAHIDGVNKKNSEILRQLILDQIRKHKPHNGN